MRSRRELQQQRAAGQPSDGALPNGEALPICGQGWVRVSAADVRRRLNPDAYARILGVWAAGQELAVWGKCGDWWLVVDMRNGAWGWSHRRYLVATGGVS